ncbi:MAG: response regulator [Alphaproteobacteria bacterium]|nr:response regulator [Alphaproteobacteria bacterium]MDE2110641.1 response regulator [Alphaproteobacteria bacterium]MDE2495070.1 response regulator [Alphaproteobacteria bacterium]
MAISSLSFETAETLVYDPVPANRTATRSVLYTLGFRRIDSVATVSDFTDAIRRRPPDLALCEVQGADGELCDMIQSLRQGAAGYNPFIVIIVTAWEKTNALVSRVLNSGADDLILRPFSTTQLGIRIEAHIERRKGFVITHDYVGPDRRRDPDRPSQAELFDPPNSLKMKAKERLTGDEATAKLDAELAQAREMLNSEKMRRDAFQICILWRLLQDHKPESASYGQELAKLARLTRAVAKRCGDSEYAAAEEWCGSVLAAVEGLELGVDRNASMHMLGHAALNLNQIFQPEKSTTDHLGKIDATVAIIRARNQQQQKRQLAAPPLADGDLQVASGE